MSALEPDVRPPASPRTPARASAPAPRTPTEETTVHTRIQQLALAIEDSRAYWSHADPALTPAERTREAFERRWFGPKSTSRVRKLLQNCAARYDAFPPSLAVLRRWPAMSPETRRVVCHWHLQLADPMYRAFTGAFLVARRAAASPSVDRDATLRWVRAEYPSRWSEPTLVQFASKLLSATSEAGITSPRRDPRALTYPKVPDDALAYLLHLLRGVRFAGTLTENPYLASVGLSGVFLDQRLRALPGVAFKRMGELTDFEFEYPDLLSWSESLS